jgi:dynein heavy chain, axonemal
MNAAKEVAADMNLIATPQLLANCDRLNGAITARFGTIILGRADAGKTVTWRVTAAAISACERLHDRVSGQSGHHAELGLQLSRDQATPGGVEATVLNPKALSLEELYGSYNPATTKWWDGLVASFLRAASTPNPGASQSTAATSTPQRWLVFDGPVDPLWAESLNSLLDDSCTLCLPSGERLQLDGAPARVIIECSDLGAASPATVSRCSVVYIAAPPLAWRTRLTAWLQDLPAALTAAAAADGHADVVVVPDTMIADIQALADEHIAPALDWLASNATVAISTTPEARVRAFLMWVQALLRPGKGWSMSDGYGSAERTALVRIVAFAFVWGLGGALAVECWPSWDRYVRRCFDGSANFPTGAGTVFDYCCNTERGFAFQARGSAMD